MASIIDQMKEAAYERAQEEAAERRRVGNIALGQPRTDRPIRDRIGAVVKLGDDFVVEVRGHGSETWTTVVGGKRSTVHQPTMELAVLHMIARRYDEWAADSAVIYAARVLGMPSDRS